MKDQLGTFRYSGYRLTIMGNVTYCTSDRCDSGLRDAEINEDGSLSF